MSEAASDFAPKVWRGRFFEDFAVGDVFRSRIGRTVTDTDNVWFAALTHNTNRCTSMPHTRRRRRFERPLVNSCFTLSLVAGLTVSDTSENAVANLGWTDIRLPAPVFARRHDCGPRAEILAIRETRSNLDAGASSVSARAASTSAARR